MRPIEFRGKVTCSIKELEEIGIKHTNGWIYGSYIDCFIIDGVMEANTEYIAIEKWCAVDSKTVGQYTNVNTPSGEKIFEGDIVEIDVHDHLDWNVIKGDEMYTTVSLAQAEAICTLVSTCERYKNAKLTVKEVLN
ncbi:hypothetical protein [Listeria monocytogenes]|uniref:hypothetical protein n=1 Tax=Listeria monocytogenes TaxID=1639 RepID=UPI001FB68661|nr:hypothetical protein [Listeria monocytogenes]